VGAKWAGDDVVPSRFGREFSHRPIIEQLRPHTRKPIECVAS
jgi:hypothetical protein